MGTWGENMRQALREQKRREKNPHKFVSKAEKRRFENDPERAKAIRKRHYLSIGGLRCPNCDSPSIICERFKEVEIQKGSELQRKVKCENCLSKWTEIYTLTNMILKEDEK